MRTGRLQESALKNIWKTLEPSLEIGMEKGLPMLPETLQKQYIPNAGDSPLYRLISVAASGGSEASLLDPFSSESRQFLRTTPTRVMSVPIIPNPLQLELPHRSAQSTGNLFRASQINTNTSHRRPSPVVVSLSTPNLQRSTSSGIGNSVDDSKQDTLLKPSNSPTSESAPSKRKNWTEDYAHMDIDWSMQAMDVLYSASFYEYIRDERNCDLSAQRLSRIIKEYKPRQVANALLWMIQGWSVENTSKLLRILFSDWLPELAG